MPRGYPNKKASDTSTAITPPPGVDNDKQALLDEIEQLKREKADLAKTQIDADPDDGLAYLKEQNAILMKSLAGVVASGNKFVDPGERKSQKSLPAGYGKHYVLTEERKQQIASIFGKYEGRGLEYKLDDISGSVTFRKKIKVRIYDKENEMWTREEAWKSESVHCSSSDATINKLIKFMLLV